MNDYFALILGVVCAGIGGELFVRGAVGLAYWARVSPGIIGATVIAKLRGHDEVGLGTILGSNIFNGIFVVAVAAIICPITVEWREVAITLMFGLMALVFTYPTRGGFIERRRGVLLLVLYAVYLGTILQRYAA